MGNYRGLERNENKDATRVREREIEWTALMQLANAGDGAR
jgi:hypothetical protein